MKDKAARQAALLRLVKHEGVSSQEDMVRILGESGFRTTQSSVSRDVRELGLVRVNGRYLLATQLGIDRDENDAVSFENELIRGAEPVGANLIVVKTAPGGANTVAVQLDGKRFPEIVGTLAGDDTLFVAVPSRSAQGRVLALLRKSANPNAVVEIPQLSTIPSGGNGHAKTEEAET